MAIYKAYFEAYYILIEDYCNVNGTYPLVIHVQLPDISLLRKLIPTHT